MINLDTHILLHALIDNLRPREKQLFKNNQCVISSIVLWEASKLYQYGKITIDPSSIRFRNAISVLQIVPIDIEIATHACRLDFQSDPADEIIAATSICHNIPLLTRDKRIKASRIVPLA